MEPQNPIFRIYQSNPEEKEQNGRQNPFRLWTILQSYSSQNSVVLIQKQAYGSTGINPCIYGQLTTGKRESLQEVVVGKPESQM